LLICAACGLAEPAFGALQLRPHGLVYDPSTNTTWLQDPMYCRTSGYIPTGKATWNVARGWVENLVYAGFDDWTFSTMPFYPNPGPIYELYYMSLGNPDSGTPTKKGPFTNLEWTSYWVMPYSGSVQNFYFEFGGSTKTPMTWPYSLEIEYAPSYSTHGAWAMRYGDVANLSPDFDHEIKGGSFDQANLSGWDVVGQGTAAVVTYPGTANYVAQLTTGSPVSLKQLTDTPDEHFQIRLDYDFADTYGQLDVLLNGKTIGTLSGARGAMAAGVFEVSDPSLWSLTSTSLELRMYSQPNMAGVAGYVDNVRIVVPEPMTMFLLSLGGLLLVRRRRT
jgi:hypothetical protein